MSVLTIAFLALVWILCGVIAAGFCFSVTMKSGAGTHRGNLLFCLAVGVCLGPVALIYSLLTGPAEHGWRLW